MINVKLFKYVVVYLLFISKFWLSSCFNFSPKPNYIFKEPKINRPKYDTSYFGYSLNLRRNSLMVGSPRAQSDLQTQQNNNQTGVIYKCDFINKNCTPYYMDIKGNEYSEYYNNGLYSKTYIKDKQWLGAVMDGSELESDPLLVCAPNIITDYSSWSSYENRKSLTSQYYEYQGVCFISFKTHNSKFEQSKILSFVDSNGITGGSLSYRWAQQGFSLHSSKNYEVVLIGAPGASFWQGTVIRYRETKYFDGTKFIYEDTIDAVKLPKESDYSGSYFGYAVTSGYFDETMPYKLHYVASAPRGHGLKGLVLIFNFKEPSSTYLIVPEKEMIVHKRFYGKQIGEYFGYALLTEDFNNDGLLDIAISAPFHSKKNSFDNGKVYVFYNKGKRIFSSDKDLQSDNEINGQFGTSFGKIGDINLDGFNDLAVGAPFEGNGVVYIFLGSVNGIIDKPSQKILSVPHQPLSRGTSHMFGMSISRGVDIDRNRYQDIAIGSPNAEVAYVYKSYPVVSIISSISSPTPVIGINDTEFKITACWRYYSKTIIPYNIKLKISIKLDNEFARAKFKKSGNRNIDGVFDVTSINNQCLVETVILKQSLAAIFRPILFELSHELATSIVDSSDFCNTCVAINPNDENFVRNTVIVRTGCKNIVCVADLKIKSSLIDLNQTYVIGTSKTIWIEYLVENDGELAFFTNILVTLPTNIRFYKIPSNCSLDGFSLRCEFEKGLNRGEKTKINVTIDASNLYGKELIIKALVNSSSDEQNNEDNKIEDTIFLEELSNVEIFGQSVPLSIPLNELTSANVFNITHQFEIRNSGPSSIKQMTFNVFMPLGYLIPSTQSKFELIEFDNIVVKGEYDDQELDLMWSENMGKNENKSYNDDENFKNYMQETIHKTEDGSFNFSNQYDLNFHNLPINRSLLFSCKNKNSYFCLKCSIDVENFKATDKYISVEITFSIDMSKVDEFFTNEQNLFVLITSSNIVKEGDEEGISMNIVNFNPYTVFKKKIKPSKPLWMFIVAGLVGLLILILLIYGLYKMGFFRRKTKEEIEKQRSLMQGPIECSETNTDED